MCTEKLYTLSAASPLHLGQVSVLYRHRGLAVSVWETRTLLLLESEFGGLYFTS